MPFQVKPETYFYLTQLSDADDPRAGRVVYEACVSDSQVGAMPVATSASSLKVEDHATRIRPLCRLQSIHFELRYRGTVMLSLEALSSVPYE